MSQSRALPLVGLMPSSHVRTLGKKSQFGVTCAGPFVGDVHRSIGDLEEALSRTGLATSPGIRAGCELSVPAWWARQRYTH